ncbi:MAG: ribosome hibernation-promoting factor, HPF/YfiA family [Paracoccaceae bacterium]
MHVQVSGKQMDVGSALAGHVEERLVQAITKYFDRPVSAHVTFARDAKSFFKCEVAVQLSTGLHAQAHGEDSDAHAAFDRAAERVEKQVRRYKRRLKDHHQRPQEPIDVIPAQSYVVAAVDEAEEEADDAVDPDAPPAIIAETRMDIRSLSVGDAVMRMELEHAPFLLFRNEASGRLNLVFQRGDGNIGWVDPDPTANAAGEG